MSQFEEDKHIDAVFNEIGYGSRVLFDVGARLEYSNSSNLILRHGFAATLVEADKKSADELRRVFPSADIIETTLKPEQVNEYCPLNCWFFTLDIDSYDWWVWANLVQRPALVVVETNPLSEIFVASMTAKRKDRDGYGMSLTGAHILANMKSYDYIGRTEVNAFYVRKELNCLYRLPQISEHCGLSCGTRNNVCA